MQYALIQGGQVVNIIEADADFIDSLQGFDAAVAHDQAQIGWAWDGQQLHAPLLPDPEPVVKLPWIPDTCSPAQGLIALYALQSITDEDIATAIAAIPDPVQRYTAQIGFNRATTWERQSATMQAMAALLGLSESDLDALFTYAAGVQV